MPLTTIRTSNLDTTNSLLFRNRIINGNMVIDQRNAGAAVTTANSFPVDRFKIEKNSDDTFSAQQDSSAPVGFTNSTKITITAADASIGSTQYFVIDQYIEGYNVADLAWGSANAKTVTLSFWVRSSLTGTFGGSLRNSAGDRNYAFTYSISAADTWEQKSVTIAGDTSGTWLTTNGVGIQLAFSLGAGSSRVATAGSWGSGVILGASGQTQVISTLNATFYITGVQLEVGTAATAFERRPYGTELNLCHRYYHYLGGDTAYQSINTVVWYGTGDAVGFFRHPVEMRSTPSIAKTGTWSTLGGSGSAGNTISGDQLGPKTVQLGCTGGSSGTSGQASTLRVSNDLNFRLTFSAEL